MFCWIQWLTLKTEKFQNEYSFHASVIQYFIKQIASIDTSFSLTRGLAFGGVIIANHFKPNRDNVIYLKIEIISTIFVVESDVFMKNISLYITRH